ncbi:MAG: Imm51 family immunity protein [Acidobacteriota bacterium]
MDGEYHPGKLVKHEDGTFSLLFTDFDGTIGIFEEMGMEGGGYSWHAVVDALVRMEVPELSKKLSYDPEASMFVAISSDANVLKEIARLIRNAIKDPQLLKMAITNADPELID